MKTIYFDNSATTPLSPSVKAAMTEMLEIYGNPSSLHTLGQEAYTRLETARRQVAATLGIKGAPLAGQLTFTSCGSEADNLAILGTAYAKARRRGGRILTTDSEHPGVERAMARLETDGFEVVRISTLGGKLDMEQYAASLTDRTFLVSLMAVNNETGAQYDIARAFALAKTKNADIVTHTDAVQGYLKCRLNPALIKADLVTVSAHKINGPKGVGALYASPDALKRRDFQPWLLGGGQEGGFRSGTENLCGIVGFGVAAAEGHAHLAENVTHLTALRTYAEQQLAALPVRLNIPQGARAPHILNLTLPDIKSETMLHALSAHGICISHGSACSSHAQKVSPSLLALGLSAADAACSIRVSFGIQNTTAEIDTFVQALSAEIARLVRVKR